MPGVAKVVLGLAALGVAAAIFIVLFFEARERALSAHCRNNLRHLGGIAKRNWSLLDPGRTGRNFWQTVRELEYRTIKGEWRPIRPDPFVCPVYGRTRTNLTDPTAIDYRGPKSISEGTDGPPRDQPIGADRPGNHGSGGNVLLFDGSTAESGPAEPQVQRAGDDDRLWKEAARVLSD